MADRRLIEFEEERHEDGPHWTLTVERSAAGRPGGLVTITHRSVDGSLAEEQMTVVLPDLRVFDAAIEWADGGPARGGLGEPRLGASSFRDADRALASVRSLERAAAEGEAVQIGGRGYVPAEEVTRLRQTLDRIRGMGIISQYVQGDALALVCEEALR